MRSPEIVKANLNRIVADVVHTVFDMCIDLDGNTSETITEKLMIAGILPLDRYTDWCILRRGCLLTLGKSEAAAGQVFKCLVNFFSEISKCSCDGCCCCEDEEDGEDEEEDGDQNDVVSEEQKKPAARMTITVTNDGFDCGAVFPDEPLDKASMTLFLKLAKAVRAAIDDANKPATIADNEKTWEEELAESERKFQELLASCGGFNPVPPVAGAALAGDSEALKKLLSKHKDETSEKPKKKTTKKSK